MQPVNYLGKKAVVWREKGVPHVRIDHVTYHQVRGWWMLGTNVITDGELIEQLNRIAIRGKVITGQLEQYFYTLPAVARSFTKPSEAGPDKDSLILIPPSNLSIQITWLDGRPGPDTQERRAGTIKVLRDLHTVMPLLDQLEIQKMVKALENTKDHLQAH